ncbi:MAG: phosphoadenylyl-sulfate reductase [Neisseria sp.]|nr:phosphoadenylyl-sulfate reductase [Neisseria sp.]
MPPPNPENQAALALKVETLAARLQDVAARFPHAVLASSLAAEDMIITDQIAKLRLPLSVITLDTGCLNPETVALIDRVRQVYPDVSFTVFYPKAEDADAFVAQFGAGAMYESVELRKRCCFIRKIEPLNRALQNAPAWLTGQRRSQSVTRSGLAFEEEDAARHIAKFNPIFDWEDDDVWTYAQTRDIPLNALYGQGYPSIGCEPCTRPVKFDEDIRAGRWWWENKDSKECGLHK